MCILQHPSKLHKTKTNKIAEEMYEPTLVVEDVNISVPKTDRCSGHKNQ